MFYNRMNEAPFDVLPWILQYFVINFKTQILEKKLLYKCFNTKELIIKQLL